jgi:hypothetical protein
VAESILELIQDAGLQMEKSADVMNKTIWKKSATSTENSALNAMKYPKCQEQNINYQNLKTQELS